MPNATNSTKPQKYEDAHLDVKTMCKQILSTYHADLNEVGLNVQFLFKFGARDTNGDLGGSTLSRGGRPAYAITAILGSVDRALKYGDARIVFDGDRWDDLETEERQAVIDDGLSRLALNKDRNGAIQWDGQGRPRLATVQPDVFVEGFRDVAERWGKKAPLCADLHYLQDSAGQILFPFDAKTAEAPEAEAPEAEAETAGKVGTRRTKKSA